MTGPEDRRAYELDDQTDVFAGRDGRVGFDLVLRGYDRRQVDEALAGFARELAAAEGTARLANARVTELESLAARLRRELADTRAKAEQTRPSYAELGERVGQMLTLAEQEATALRQEAAAEVDPIRQHSITEAGELLASAQADAERTRRAATEEAQALVQEASEQHDRLVAETDAHRRRAEHDVAAERRRVERETNQSRHAAQGEVRRTLDQARGEARGLLLAAQREVDGLTQQRDRVRGELARLREGLGVVVDAVDTAEPGQDVAGGQVRATPGGAHVRVAAVPDDAVTDDAVTEGPEPDDAVRDDALPDPEAATAPLAGGLDEEPAERAGQAQQVPATGGSAHPT